MIGTEYGIGGVGCAEGLLERSSGRPLLSWPYDSPEKLREAGYHFDGWGQCRAPECRARLHFYVTPKGKRMPMDPETCQPHWASCKAVQRFKRPAEKTEALFP